MVWGEGVSKFETRNMFALKFILGQLNLNLECGHGCTKFQLPAMWGGRNVEEMRVQVVIWEF